MNNLEMFLRICLMGFSLILLLASMAAYVRMKNMKFLFVAIAFFAFFMKGALLTLDIFYRDLEFNIDLELIALDFVVMIFLYAAVAKR